MNAQRQKGQVFRALHDGPATFIMPNPGDAGTARLIERAGFKAIGTSSAAAAFGLGLRDGEVGQDEMIKHLAAICSATSLPVSADLGNGFGASPSAVADTILRAAEAGAVGGSIEDATGNQGAPIFARSLAIERIVAASETARSLDFPFVLTARADHFIVGVHDLGDVVERLAAYREAGADVLYAPALPDEGAVREALGAAGNRPLNVLAQGQGVASDIRRLCELGVKRVSLGSALSRIAYTSLMRSIRTIWGGNLNVLNDAIPLSEANRIFGEWSPDNEEK